MKIIENVNKSVDVDIIQQSVDNKFKFYNKKTNTHDPAVWIDKTPFFNKNHVCCLTGSAGSGKTTLALSLISSKKHRVYQGVFDKILVCCPPSTLNSLQENNPFKNLPSNQIFDVFDEDFLDEAMELLEVTSLEQQDVLLFIDDAASKLKNNKKVIDKLSEIVMKHRHLRCTVYLLCQDLIQVPLTIRENCNMLIYFKPLNSKRTKLFWEEFLPQISYREFLQLCDFIFTKKGDFLIVKNTEIREFYKNFNLLSFNSIDNGI
jgi:GTPase SAR1 family protein